MAEESSPKPSRNPSPSDILYPFGGKPQRATHTKRKVHPEQDKLDKMFAVMYAGHEVKHGFWSTTRRLKLNCFSQRIFFMCAIAGIVLIGLTFVWKILLIQIENIYEVKTVDPSAPMTSVVVEVRTPFIEDIKLAKEGLYLYRFGACLLAIGGLWSYATMDEKFRLRLLLYFFGIIIMLLSTAAMILGPMFPLRAENSKEEANSLAKDEYMSRDKAVLGSIKYFRSGQCSDLDKATADKDDEKAHEIRVFCDLIVRLIVVFHFMWLTIVFPILAIVMSLLQIIVNNKYWNQRKPLSYKKRTPEQIKEDKCIKD